MKKPDISQTVSILANIGVIAGIVFLAFELNQNNALLESQARYNLVVQRAAVSGAAREPRVLNALQKQAAGEELDVGDRMALVGVASSVVENWEWQYREYRAGLLELRQLPVANWRRIFHGGQGVDGESGASLPVQDVWNTRASELDPEFVQFMEANVVNER